MRSMSTNKTRTIITSAAALAVTAGLAATAGAASLRKDRQECPVRFSWSSPTTAPSTPTR